MTRLLPLSLALLLGGCATLPEPPSRPGPEQTRAWLAHRAAVDALTEWHLLGRLAVNTEDDGWSGKLRWRQGDDTFRIAFEAPFGQGAMRLLSDVGGVVMEVSDGRTYRAPDADALLYQFMGVRLPVNGLRYWLTGVPQPGTQTSALEYDAAGRLTRLEQADWRIRYTEYQPVGHVDLPHKIRMENRLLDLRLVIDRWGIQG